MYIVACKNCGELYESNANRPGICPNCKKHVRGRTNTEYRDRTYDRITVYVPKGEREMLKTVAEQHGTSVNDLINRALQFYLHRISKDEYEKALAVVGAYEERMMLRQMGEIGEDNEDTEEIEFFDEPF